MLKTIPTKELPGIYPGAMLSDTEGNWYLVMSMSADRKSITLEHTGTNNA